jgi:hypothetical protein
MTVMMMRSFELRSALLLMVTLGLSACPSDDTGDEGAGTVAATTTASADTEPGSTTTPDEGGTTEASEDSTTASMVDSTSGGGLVLADIEVTVIYEGELTGTLNVVAVTELPPMGPPVAVASEMAPVFPYAATLDDLEVGEYIIFATLDVGGDNPTIPGPEDPQSDVTMPVVVTVDGPGPFQAEVTLIDPA